LISRPQIILFGDSITQLGFGEVYLSNSDIIEGYTNYNQVGWASLLSAAYSRRADVLNRGFSGYNTRHAPLLSSISHTRKEKDNHNDANLLLFSTIFFVANDASPPGMRQHVPLDEYEKNLETIIEYIRDNPIYITQNTGDDLFLPILLITPPPVASKKWETFCIQTGRPVSLRCDQRGKEYSQVVQKISQKYKCPVLDSFTLFGGDTDDESIYQHYLYDGLHLNREGNLILYQALMDLIQKSLPNLAPMIDGEGIYGTTGIPLQEKLWKELC